MEENKEILEKLEAIKRLLALSLINSGVNVEDVGKAMGVSAGRVSQILGQKRSRKSKRGA